MGAVSAAVGVVSTVAGIASANKQAAAQQASVQASNQANKANYANQLATIAAKKGYADYQAHLSALSNQGLLSQQQLGIQYNNILTNIKTSGEDFANQQKILQQQTQNVGDKRTASTIRYTAEQQALQERAQGDTQNITAQNQIGQAAAGDNSALQTGLSQQAMQQAYQAAMQGNNSWQSLSGAAQRESSQNQLSQRVGADRQSQAGALAAAQLQQQYLQTITGQQQQLGNFNADALVQNADNALAYSEAAGAYNTQAIQNERTNNDLASQTAIAQLQGASQLDALTNKANTLMSDQGLATQANAAATTFGSQQSALAAQQNSIQGASLGQYAQAGIGLYNLGSGLLSSFNGSGTSAQAASGTNYSVNNSVNLTPYTPVPEAQTMYSGGFLSGNTYG